MGRKLEFSLRVRHTCLRGKISDIFNAPLTIEENFDSRNHKKDKSVELMSGYVEVAVDELFNGKCKMCQDHRDGHSSDNMDGKSHLNSDDLEPSEDQIDGKDSSFIGDLIDPATVLIIGEDYKIENKEILIPVTTYVPLCKLDGCKDKIPEALKILLETLKEMAANGASEEMAANGVSEEMVASGGGEEMAANGASEEMAANGASVEMAANGASEEVAANGGSVETKEKVEEEREKGKEEKE